MSLTEARMHIADGVLSSKLMFKAGKMKKRNDLSESNKDQTVMAGLLGQNVSKTAALVGCFRLQWSVSIKVVQRSNSGETETGS